MAGNIAYLVVGIVAGLLLGYWLAYYAIGLLPLLILAAVLCGAGIVWLYWGRGPKNTLVQLLGSSQQVLHSRLDWKRAQKTY